MSKQISLVPTTWIMEKGYITIMEDIIAFIVVLILLYLVVKKRD